MLVVTLFSFEREDRPRLMALEKKDPVKKGPGFSAIRKKIAIFKKPLAKGPLGRRILKDLNVAQVNISPEEFLLLKEIAMVLLFIVVYPQVTADTMMFWMGLVFVGGYMLPEFWLRSKVQKVKKAMIRELPDTVDLLGLCVNAGLDFMLAIKWVIDKSKDSILMRELNLILQEINVGKPRREALRDLSAKYELTDLSTFSRTLIQADRMGTSIGDALNILSEDMRLARFRRGEQVALKAPLKMLVPLLFFIFPVVAILVGAPILIDFMSSSSLSGNAMFGR